jgi:hypothetical protein
MTPNTNPPAPKQKRWWLGPPESSGMKKTFGMLVLAVLGILILAGFLAHESVSSGKNAMPAVNLLACALFSLTLIITANTSGGKKWLSFAMVVVSIAGIIIFLIGLTDPASLIANHAWGVLNFATFVAAIPLVFTAIIRYCYKPGTRVGGRSVGMFKFILIWFITINACVQMATVSEAQTTGAPTTQGQSALQVNGSGTEIGVSGDGQTHPNFWFCLGILVVVVVILGVVYWVCRAAHICGNTAMPPPSSTAASAAAVAASAKFHSLATAKTALSADDVRLDSLLAQAITPDGVALWTNTCGIHDKYIDVDYPFTQTINYSVVGTTNLDKKTGWHTLYTIVQWQTSDPSSPLVCQVIYTNSVTKTGNGGFVTNGVPIGTNRWQFVLAYTGGKPYLTGTITYGDVCRVPVDSSMSAPHMFFQTCINTNEVSTFGP